MVSWAASLALLVAAAWWPAGRPALVGACGPTCRRLARRPRRAAALVVAGLVGAAGAGRLATRATGTGPGPPAGPPRPAAAARSRCRRRSPTRPTGGGALQRLRVPVLRAGPRRAPGDAAEAAGHPGGAAPLPARPGLQPDASKRPMHLRACELARAAICAEAQGQLRGDGRRPLREPEGAGGRWRSWRRGSRLDLARFKACLGVASTEARLASRHRGRDEGQAQGRRRPTWWTGRCTRGSCRSSASRRRPRLRRARSRRPGAAPSGRARYSGTVRSGAAVAAGRFSPGASGGSPSSRSWSAMARALRALSRTFSSPLIFR